MLRSHFLKVSFLFPLEACALSFSPIVLVIYMPACLSARIFLPFLPLVALCFCGILALKGECDHRKKDAAQVYSSCFSLPFVHHFLILRNLKETWNLKICLISIRAAYEPTPWLCDRWTHLPTNPHPPDPATFRLDWTFVALTARPPHFLKWL